MLKMTLRRIFSPIIRVFENGDETYEYKALNRKILLVVGILFSGLALAVTVIVFRNSDYGYLLPAIVFFSVGTVCLVVGGLGSDRAVAKIWGKRR